MILHEGKLDKNFVKVNNWKYYGELKDKKRQIWSFWTNSTTQYNKMIKDKMYWEMKLLWWEKNKNYEIINKLME